MSFFQIIGSLETGLIYGIVAIGVWLTFRVINFADLTVDGSFALGAAISSSLIVSGYDPVIASILGGLGGCLAGSFTALLFLKGGVIEILTGILSMTALYSINLRIMESPNVGLFGKQTIFTKYKLPLAYEKTALIFFVVLSLVLILSLLFKTNFGLGLIATGNNPVACRSFGISTSTAKIITIALSNGLVAFAGSLFCQSEGFADSSMGGGTIIAGLAAVVLGESFLRNRSILIRLLACVVGSIIYRAAVSWALSASSIGLKSSDLSLISALLVIGSLQFPRIKLLINRKVAMP